MCHVYGLTEVYGPAVINEWHRPWSALPASEQAELNARQGVRYSVLGALLARATASRRASRAVRCVVFRARG